MHMLLHGSLQRGNFSWQGALTQILSRLCVCLRTCIFPIFSEIEQNPTCDKPHGGQGSQHANVLRCHGCFCECCLVLGVCGWVVWAADWSHCCPFLSPQALTSWACSTKHVLALPAALLSSSCFLQESGVFLAVNALLAWFMNCFFQVTFWFPFTVNLLIESSLLQGCLYSGWGIATICVVHSWLNHVLFLGKKGSCALWLAYNYLGWPDWDWSQVRGMLVMVLSALMLKLKMELQAKKASSYFSFHEKKIIFILLDWDAELLSDLGNLH